MWGNGKRKRNSDAVHLDYLCQNCPLSIDSLLPSYLQCSSTVKANKVRPNTLEALTGPLVPASPCRPNCRQVPITGLTCRIRQSLADGDVKDFAIRLQFRLRTDAGQMELDSACAATEPRLLQGDRVRLRELQRQYTAPRSLFEMFAEK